MINDHRHGDDGHVVAVEPSPPAEVAEAAEAASDAAVRIAEVEAKRDVEVARIGARVDEHELAGRVEALEGELRGLREVLDRIAPPEPPEPEPAPGPAPVIVEAGTPPKPEPELVPPPAEGTPKNSKPAGWWAGYR